MALDRKLVLALTLALGLSRAARTQEPSEPPPTLEGLLKQIASAPADACTYPGTDFSDLEYQLFSQADNAVVQELNETSNSPASEVPTAAKIEIPGSSSTGEGSPEQLARKALGKLEHLSAEMNESWPEEKRFHFVALNLPPALVVKMTFRNRAIFSFFGIPQRDPHGKPTRLWQAAGALDDHRFKPSGGYDWLDLFPLKRGPSKRARFLAKFGDAGCGSGVGVAYYVYEWNPQDRGDLSELIKLEGAVSQEDPVRGGQPLKKGLSDSFPPIGELRTGGSIITLPYCWFSTIETWDNPSLCAVDSYDISGDRVRFVSLLTNRPDLLPVAKAVQYAQAHDYPAVLAYCGSPDVARQMVRDIPPSVFGVGLSVTKIGPAKERVELDDEETFQFEVEKRGDRWLVVAFRVR